MKPDPSFFLGVLLSLALANVARAEWQVWTLTETRHVLRSELPGAGTTAKLGAARNEWDGLRWQFETFRNTVKPN
jgi:hypothetical protein